MLKTTHNNKKARNILQIFARFFAMNVENIFSLIFGSIRLEYMKLVSRYLYKGYSKRFETYLYYYLTRTKSSWELKNMYRISFGKKSFQKLMWKRQFKFCRAIFRLCWLKLIKSRSQGSSSTMSLCGLKEKI